MCYEIEFVGGSRDGRTELIPCLGFLPEPDGMTSPDGETYIKEREREDGVLVFVHTTDGMPKDFEMPVDPAVLDKPRISPSNNTPF